MELLPPRVGVISSARAEDVKRALEARYNPPSKPRQYATFEEVSDAHQRRRVDYLAVNLWQSRGREIHGVEVKVDRRDWLRELAHPKADSWYGVVNHWWIAAPQGIVFDYEVPKSWGYMECLRTADGWKMKVKVKAPDLPEPTDEWPNWLVMRLLTRVDERRKATPAELTAARQEATTEAYERGKQAGSYGLSAERSSEKELADLLMALGDSDFRWRRSEERVAQIRRAREMLDTGRLEVLARRTAGMFREASDSILAALPAEEGGDEHVF